MQKVASSDKKDQHVSALAKNLSASSEFKQ
jgi:hypothetical protein